MNHLPNDILPLIFKDFDCAERAKISRVCKHWYGLAWRNIDTIAWKRGILPTELVTLLQKVKCLDLSLNIVPKDIFDEISSYPDLKRLEVRFYNKIDTISLSDSIFFEAYRAPFPLHTSVKNSNHGLLKKLLLPLRNTLNTYNKEGQTPLIAACLINDPESVKILLSHGAEKETPAQYNPLITPLYICTKFRPKPEIAKLLN